jgi:hypothetical protein
MNFLLALLLAQAATPQGRVFLCDKASPTKCASVDAAGAISISGSFSAAGTADVVSAAAPTTFNANTICTGTLLLAGEQGAGFQLDSGGTLVGTLTPQYSIKDTGSDWTTTQFIDQNGSKTPSISATNPNTLNQLGIVVVTGTRRVQVCTTAYTSGTGTGFAVAAFVQGGAAAAGGGGGSTDVAIHDSGTPSQHLGVNASGQAAIQNPPNLDAAVSTLATQATLALIKAKTDNLDVLLSTRTKPADTQLVDGSAVTQPVSGTFWQATQPVSGTFWQATQPVSGTFWQVTQPVSGTVTANQGGAPWTGRIQDGAGAPLATVTAGNALKVDGSAVTQPVSGTVAATQSGTWTVQPGNTANTTAWKVDGSAVTQPVSGTVASTQSGTWTVQPGNTANTTAWKVDGSAVTQPVSGTVTANQGGTWTVQPGNTANTTAWKVDGSAVTQPVSVAATLNVQGAKTNNNAAPGATNVGVLPILANAATPAWTEGNLVAGSSDLAGSLRATLKPPVVTGAYRINVTTSQYTALAAGNVIASFRFTAAALCVVTRVRIFVTTQTAASAAGRIDRALFIVRSFTVADSGGTAITLTSPVGKLRTSHAAMGVGNIMVSSGNALTTGTGTQDANPVGVIATAGTATEPIGTTLPVQGGDSDLFVYHAEENFPIVLAQNEGLRVTIPTGMPSSIAQISSITFEWYEVGTSNF